MSKFRSVFLSIAIFLMTIPDFAQEPLKAAATQTEASRTYLNTSEGLRLFLEDLLEATKSGNQPRTSALIRLTEIPNHETWFHKMYPADKAESWIEPYGRDLEANEQSLKDLLTNLANRSGFVTTRKLQDSGSSDRGLEWAMLHSAKEPFDIYFAGWVNSTGDKPESIGYFIFIDGMFRWDSLIHFVRPKVVAGSPPTASGPARDLQFSGQTYRVGGDVKPPVVLSSADPEYTKEANKAKLQGVVLLAIVVDVDGLPKNIRVLRPLGKGLDEKAVEAVSRWKFKPATKKGQYVPAAINIEVSFNLN